jgi:hypothetical protein
LTPATPFELLELPDGRWYVARPAAMAGMTLVAGSFARLETAGEDTSAPAQPYPDPVGVYASRDEAERAIVRSAPAPGGPLAPFAQWMCRD